MATDNLVRVEFDLKSFKDGFTVAVQREIPFAFAQALTALGREAQKAVRADLTNEFTLRNKWVSSNIRIDPERVPKGGMEVAVGSRLMRGNNLMELEATGGTGHAKKGGEIAIPTSALRGSTTNLISPAKRPKALLRNGQGLGGRAFFAVMPNGHSGIYERKGKARLGIQKDYTIVPSVTIKAIWPLEQVVGHIAADQWQALAAAALQRALKPRK